MIKNRWFFGALFILFTLSIFPGCSKKLAATQSAGNASFKTIGYLLINRPGLPGTLSQFDFSRITHLNLAFVNPDSTGAFPDNPVIPQVVDLAHKAGVKVLMSIGGGNIPVWFAGFLQDDKRPAFDEALVAVVNKYKLDGLDVDLEGGAIDGHYSSFVNELSTAMKANGKLLTAAVATAYGPNTPDEALAEFDFINIMSYDKTGPWRPSEGGPHAPYEMAVSDLSYWGTTRAIPKSKMNMGLPFYGYGFSPGNMATSMEFGAIATTYPASASDDQLTLPDGGTLYYNGITTIRKKTALAMKQAGGVMIWELMQDAAGASSLLQNIHEVETGR